GPHSTAKRGSLPVLPSVSFGGAPTAISLSASPLPNTPLCGGPPALAPPGASPAAADATARASVGSSASPGLSPPSLVGFGSVPSFLSPSQAERPTNSAPATSHRHLAENLGTTAYSSVSGAPPLRARSAGEILSAFNPRARLAIPGSSSSSGGGSPLMN